MKNPVRGHSQYACGLRLFTGRFRSQAVDQTRVAESPLSSTIDIAESLSSSWLAYDSAITRHGRMSSLFFINSLCRRGGYIESIGSPLRTSSLIVFSIGRSPLQRERR